MVEQIEKFPYEKDKQGNKIWGQDTIGDYFHLEYIWHTVLLKQDENIRLYWEARYRHLLSTTHALGSLFISLFVSLLIAFGIHAVDTIKVTTNLLSFYLLFGLAIQIAVFVSVGVNYVYYSNNMRTLQTKVMKEYFHSVNGTSSIILSVNGKSQDR
jgi:hypothetical protein